MGPAVADAVGTRTAHRDLDNATHMRHHHRSNRPIIAIADTHPPHADVKRWYRTLKHSTVYPSLENRKTSNRASNAPVRPHEDIAHKNHVTVRTCAIAVSSTTLRQRRAGSLASIAAPFAPLFPRYQRVKKVPKVSSCHSLTSSRARVSPSYPHT